MLRKQTEVISEARLQVCRLWGMHPVLENNDSVHDHRVYIRQEQKSDYYTESKSYCILADSLAEYQEKQ
jgi:hypothetical protein